MNGNELSQLIDQRWSALNELLELSHRQTEAIDAGRMSDLMRVLSKKQAPLQQLSDIADRTRTAVDDDPALRHWASESDRQACRLLQDKCDQMHLDLLAIEAACESTLQENRSSIQTEIDQLNASHQAAMHYSPENSVATSGGQLDLSE